MVGDLGVFYQKRCLISPRRDDKKSLAWLRFADGHLEGGLEQMYVFYVREAFDRVLATFSSVGSLLSRPRSASDDGPSQSKDESSLKTVDLKLAGPLVHLAGSRTYAAASSASEWAGAPDGLTVDLGLFILGMDQDSWRIQMEKCTFYDEGTRLGSAQGQKR